MKDLQRILGDDALQRLATFCAGHEFYISGNPGSKAMARLAAIVGPDKTAALVNELQGSRIRVPTVKASTRAQLKAQVRALWATKSSKREIARVLRVDAKTVRNILKEQG